MKQLLRHAGREVTEAANGEEATFSELQRALSCLSRRELSLPPERRLTAPLSRDRIAAIAKGRREP